MRTFKFLVILFILIQSICNADEFILKNYKNILIGGRASTMGGAYTAISDDASGTVYNPAGLALTLNDSISGSAKIWHESKTTYLKTIGSSDWIRESSNFLANFFGLIKKFHGHTIGVSYAIPNSIIEHQDQDFNNPNSLVNEYHMNKHLEDTSNHLSISYANKTSQFSYGLTLTYIDRFFVMTDHFLEELSNGQESTKYSSTTLKEKGIKPKLGLLWQGQKISLGATAAINNIIDSKYHLGTNTESTSTTNNSFNSITNTDVIVKPPFEFSLGLAYFNSPYLLFAFDFDYFLSNSVYTIDTWNISMGTEFYTSRSHAFRMGIFTNNSNQMEVSSATVGKTNIDMYGATLGYTNFAKDSSITLGLIYSMGSGKSQPYGNSTERVIERHSISIVMSADYGF